MERNDPPARRKSCQACKKARRRCDLARPTCQRCAQRNIHCHYPSAPAPRESASCIHPESQISNIEGLLAPSCFGMLDPILEPTDHFANQLFDGSLDCDTSNWSTPRLSTTAQNALNRSQLVTIPQVTRSISSRLQYAMDAILKGPTQMVSENQTPWCHSHLYDDGMPKSMQREFTVCTDNPRITIRDRCGIFCCTPCGKEPSQRQSHPRQRGKPRAGTPRQPSTSYSSGNAGICTSALHISNHSSTRQRRPNLRHLRSHHASSRRSIQRAHSSHRHRRRSRFTKPILRSDTPVSRLSSTGILDKLDLPRISQKNPRYDKLFHADVLLHERRVG